MQHTERGWQQRQCPGGAKHVGFFLSKIAPPLSSLALHTPPTHRGGGTCLPPLQDSNCKRKGEGGLQEKTPSVSVIAIIARAFSSYLPPPGYQWGRTAQNADSICAAHHHPCRGKAPFSKRKLVVVQAGQNSTNAGCASVWFHPTSNQWKALVVAFKAEEKADRGKNSCGGSITLWEPPSLPTKNKGGGGGIIMSPQLFPVGAAFLSPRGSFGDLALGHKKARTPTESLTNLNWFLVKSHIIKID